MKKSKSICDCNRCFSRHCFSFFFIILWKFIDCSWIIEFSNFVTIRFLCDEIFIKSSLFVKSFDNRLYYIAHASTLINIDCKKCAKTCSTFFRATIFLLSKNNRYTKITIFVFTFTIFFNHDVSNKFSFFVFFVKMKRNTIQSRMYCVLM